MPNLGQNRLEVPRPGSVGYVSHVHRAYDYSGPFRVLLMKKLLKKYIYNFPENFLKEFINESFFILCGSQL